MMSSPPPLPVATIGSLMGLLEAMRRTPGPDKVSSLAAKLHLGLDRLLPLLEAAEMMGWVYGQKGVYDLTDQGNQVAGGTEAERKRLFRARAREAPLLRAVVDALAAAGGKPVPREKILALHLGGRPEAEKAAQIETAVNWGRYAELFDYDAEEGCFLLPGS